MELVLASIFNFAVVVFILVYFGRKPIKDFLVARSETIAVTIREAEKQAAEADTILLKSQTAWEGSEASARTQQGEAKSSMERIRESALADARVEAERVKKEARLVGQSETSKARFTLQKEVVEKSVRVAQAYLAGHLTDKDQAKLVSDYVEIVKNGAA